jgi:1-acyl-sn-glycerol-3-phosphate acyltransferase
VSISLDDGGTGPAHHLSRTEKMARTIGRLANETAQGRRLQAFFLRSVAYSWMRAGLARRVFVDGLERAAALRPERGVLLVSNHQTAFDRLVLLMALWSGRVPWAREPVFPVRSTFFYDHPMGMVTNLLGAAGALWPPFDRRPDRAALDSDAIELTVDSLTRPDSFVALHAADEVDAAADPYDLPPARADTGRIAVESRSLVLPIFLNGLSVDILADVRASFRPTIRRDGPCIAVVGEPIDLSQYWGDRSAPDLWSRAADTIRSAITDLGDREKSLRARCAAGGIADDHPGWLSNRRRGLPFFRARH